MAIRRSCSTRYCSVKPNCEIPSPYLSSTCSRASLPDHDGTISVVIIQPLRNGTILRNDDHPLLHPRRPLRFIDAIAITAGQIDEVEFFARHDLFNYKEPIPGMIPPSFIQPLLGISQNGALDKIRHRRHFPARILEQDRLEQHRADVLLIVIHDLVRKPPPHRPRQSPLVERHQDQEPADLFTQGFSSITRVVRLAENTLRRSCSPGRNTNDYRRTFSSSHVTTPLARHPYSRPASIANRNLRFHGPPRPFACVLGGLGYSSDKVGYANFSYHRRVWWNEPCPNRPQCRLHARRGLPF